MGTPITIAMKIQLNLKIAGTVCLLLYHYIICEFSKVCVNIDVNIAFMISYKRLENSLAVAYQHVQARNENKEILKSVGRTT